jgi:hypothetical protein
MAKNLLLVVLEDRPGPAGRGKAHMLIVRWFLRIIFSLALLLFLPAATLHWWWA